MGQLGDRTTGLQVIWTTGKLGDRTTGRQEVVGISCFKKTLATTLLGLYFAGIKFRQKNSQATFFPGTLNQTGKDHNSNG